MSKLSASKLGNTWEEHLPVYEVNEMFTEQELKDAESVRKIALNRTNKGIHFFHIRKYNMWGEPKNNCGYTVAAKVDPNLNGIFYVKARCSKKDNFSKKIGREVAAGRLACNKHLEFYNSTDFRAFKAFLFGEQHEGTESQENASF